MISEKMAYENSKEDVLDHQRRHEERILNDI